jgi:hypothetical protein
MQVAVLLPLPTGNWRIIGDRVNQFRERGAARGRAVVSIEWERATRQGFPTKPVTGGKTSQQPDAQDAQTLKGSRLLVLSTPGAGMQCRSDPSWKSSLSETWGGSWEARCRSRLELFETTEMSRTGQPTRLVRARPRRRMQLSWMAQR